MVMSVCTERPDLLEMLVNRNPMRRICSPHEMGGTLVWLASDASSFVTGTKYVVAASSGLHNAD